MKIRITAWIEVKDDEKFLKIPTHKVLRVESQCESSFGERTRVFISERTIPQDGLESNYKKSMIMNHLSSIIDQYGPETIQEVEIL